jgi:hypothetical protein
VLPFSVLPDSHLLLRTFRSSRKATRGPAQSGTHVVIQGECSAFLTWNGLITRVARGPYAAYGEYVGRLLTIELNTKSDALEMTCRIYLAEVRGQWRAFVNTVMALDFTFSRIFKRAAVCAVGIVNCYGPDD